MKGEEREDSYADPCGELRYDLKRRNRKVVKNTNDDFSAFMVAILLSAVIILSVVSLISLLGVSSISPYTAQQSISDRSSSYPDSIYYSGWWHNEVMYTPKIEDSLGITLFYESDSYAYGWSVFVPTSRAYTSFTITNSYVPAIDRIVNGWQYSSPGVELIYFGTVVLTPVGASHPVYSQLQIIHHRFSAGWGGILGLGAQKYKVSYYLYLYGDTSVNYISGSWSFDTSGNSIVSVSFPVEFD